MDYAQTDKQVYFLCKLNVNHVIVRLAMALRWLILTWRNDKWSAQNQSCKIHQNLNHLPPSSIFSSFALNVHTISL